MLADRRAVDLADRFENRRLQNLGGAVVVFRRIDHRPGTACPGLSQETLGQHGMHANPSPGHMMLGAGQGGADFLGRRDGSHQAVAVSGFGGVLNLHRANLDRLNPLCVGDVY